MPVVIHDTAPTVISNDTHKKRMGFIKWMATRFVAKHHAGKIIRSLNEVREIKTGKRAAKSFDQFLKEI